MIIWINGAFGAGKTTLAEELSRRLSEAVLFDPEYVGYLSRPCRTTRTPGRNTGATNCARVLLWSAPIMHFAWRVFAR